MLLYLALGQREQALRELEKAPEDRADWYILMGADPRLDPLRDEPRFRALLELINVPTRR